MSPDYMAMARRDLFLGVLAALIWGATFPITAVALDSTPPIFFAFLRFACAAMFVIVVPKPEIPWRYLLAAGLLLGAGQFGFMFYAMTKGISAGLASLLVHTQAFFTVAIAMVAFSERLRLRQVGALALALAGLGCFVVDRAEAGTLAGLGLILVAAFCGASGNNVLKSLGKVNMLGVAVWMSIASPLPLLAISISLEFDDIGDMIKVVSWQTLVAVAYSAVLATVIAFAIWGRLLVTYSASMVAPFFLLVPVFGIGLSTILLDETMSQLEASGALLVFAGLAVLLYPGKSARIRSG